MKCIAVFLACFVALAVTACSPGERALGGAGIGGLAGAAIGGAATGRTSGALAGAALGAAGGAIVGAATTPEPEMLEEPIPAPAPVYAQPLAPPVQHSQPRSAPVVATPPTTYGKPICRYGTYTLRGQEYCKP